MEDVKQPRAYIPPVPAPSSSRIASHGYFKVFLLVETEPDNFVEMIPITIDRPDDVLTVQRFVAIPGKAFQCRVELDKAPPQGQRWGCRVYIDEGCENHQVFDVAKGGDAEVGMRVDQSTYDHYFWFNSKQTSHTVGSFYSSGEERYGFKFGDLTRSAESYHGVDQVEETARRIGSLRFQFSLVEKMVPRVVRRRHDKKSAVPTVSKDFVDGVLKRKGTHFCTGVGKRMKVEKRSKNVAELKYEIAYESRIIFNDLAGYQAQQDFHVYKEPTRLRALPLAEFNTNKTKRKFFIELFLTWLQNNRYTRIEGLVNPGTPAPSGVASPDVNSAVGTEDLVHFMNATLSPTAAYIICIGKQVPEDFHVHETLVQMPMRTVSAAHRDALFAEKEKGLVDFFHSDPNNYELVRNGVDEKGRELYDVKKRITVIEDDSDSQ